MSQGCAELDVGVGRDPFSFMVVEGEVLNDFPRLVNVLIAEFAAGCAVNLALKMKGDIIIKDLDFEPTIDAMMRDFLE
nr:hypothetical protein [Tanacetum cinerariifolium]